MIMCEAYVVACWVRMYFIDWTKSTQKKITIIILILECERRDWTEWFYTRNIDYLENNSSRKWHGGFFKVIWGYFIYFTWNKWDRIRERGRIPLPKPHISATHKHIYKQITLNKILDKLTSMCYLLQIIFNWHRVQKAYTRQLKIQNIPIHIKMQDTTRQVTHRHNTIQITPRKRSQILIRTQNPTYLAVVKFEGPNFASNKHTSSNITIKS